MDRIDFVDVDRAFESGGRHDERKECLEIRRKGWKRGSRRNRLKSVGDVGKVLGEAYCHGR